MAFSILKHVVGRGVRARLGTPIFTRFATTTSAQPNEAPHEEEPDKLYRLIELEMRGNDPAVLKSYSKFVNFAASELNIDVGPCWTPKKATHERLTVLRSIHVNKKCRVQYETRTYYTFVRLNKLTGSTTDTFLEYIQRNLPEGVAMKTTKVALETIPDYIEPPQL